MWGAVADALPSAIGVAISPIPIIAVILMLMSKRAASNGIAFVAGWMLALAAVSLIVLNAGADAGVDSGTPNQVMEWIKFGVGILFLVMAAANWRARPKPGQKPTMPKWMSAVDKTRWPFAFLLAVVLAAVNPKNLGLTIAGVASIAEADLPGKEAVGATAVFVGIASLSLALPLLYYLVAGAHAKTLLLKCKTWLARYNAIIMAILLLVLGAKLTVQALMNVLK